MRRAVDLAAGIVFGIVLARSGAADFDAMNEMFLFKDFHLFGVALVSTGLTMLGLFALRRARRRALQGGPIRFQSRPLHRGSVLGAAIFGVGWGVCGACPGTALVQLGQGHLVALATVAGVACGSLLFPVVNRRYLGWATASCE